MEVWGVLARPGKHGVTEVKLQRSGEFSVPLAGFKRLYGKLDKPKDRLRTLRHSRSSTSITSSSARGAGTRGRS